MPARRSLPLLAVFALQIALLTIGIGRDYRLKHEDNNALHATFARSHLRLGLGQTRGQNYFFDPTNGQGSFYPNHPPGPGLVLAIAYRLTGTDGPLTTRVTAILFHLLAAWLFLGLARRLMERERDVILAVFLFGVLPESAFFGRMMNHEVLVLPGAILLVRGYWESLHGDWASARWTPVIALGSAWVAVSGWAGFFVIGACAAHAGWEAAVRRNPRARATLAVLVVAGSVLFVLDIAQLLWVLQGDTRYLRDILASRMTTGNSLGQWLGRIFELHWRYFGLTSAAGLAVIAYRAARVLRSAASDPEVEVGAIFLVAGAAYVAAFNFNAGAHDYWQFLLLPASAIGIVLVVRYLLTGMSRRTRRFLWQGLLVLAIVDIAVTTAVTLVMRHTKPEGRVLTVVEQLRRDAL